MWVLIVMLAGNVALHDFDDKAACAHAAELLVNGTKGEAIAFCVERGHSVLGPHDSLDLK